MDKDLQSEGLNQIVLFSEQCVETVEGQTGGQFVTRFGMKPHGIESFDEDIGRMIGP
jgi:hypothetical protein